MPQQKPNWIDVPPRDWGEKQAYNVAREIRRLRGKRSAQWVSDRTAERGFPVSRTVISDLENGRRRYVTTAELITIAAVLNVAPALLLYPAPYDDDVEEFIPGVESDKLSALQWFSGHDDGSRAELHDDHAAYQRNARLMRIALDLASAERDKAKYVAVIIGPPDEKAALEQRLGVHIERIVSAIDDEVQKLVEEREALNDGG